MFIWLAWHTLHAFGSSFDLVPSTHVSTCRSRRWRSP